MDYPLPYLGILAMVLLSLPFLPFSTQWTTKVVWGRFAFVIVGITVRLEIVFYVRNSRFKSENIDTQKNNISK